jgi:alpha-methylacyl-CoA racemase
LRHLGHWTDERGHNGLDGSAPYYDTYECADGRYVAVGALEDRFWHAVLAGLGMSPAEFPDRFDPASWPPIHDRFTAAFLSRPRDEWVEHFAGTEACVSPVLTFEEARSNEHIRARGVLVEVGGVVQPAPAPRFSRTPSDPPTPPTGRTWAVEELLSSWTG